MIPQHFSVRNAFIATRNRKCHCRAYEEILSKGRWIKLGFLPKRNARPTLIRLWLPFTGTDRIGQRLVRSQRTVTALLFCRCQVESNEGASRRAA